MFIWDDRILYNIHATLENPELPKLESEMSHFAAAANLEYFENLEVLLIGEKIREALHDADLIKNRKYHLRTYRSCIVGKDLVDWLVDNKHTDTRELAIEGLRILQDHSIIHHVCDDHLIKDKELFYRFRRDDDSYLDYTDLALFYRAIDLYNGLSRRTNSIIKNYQQDGELYRNAFQGTEFVDYLLSDGVVYNREEGVVLGRRLLENDTIRHVTDDFHFRDDVRLLYQFTLDFSRRRHLAEVFNYTSNHAKDESAPNFEFHTPKSSPLSTPDGTRRVSRSPHRQPSPDGDLGPPYGDRQRSVSGDSGNGTDSSETAIDKSSTKSVLLHHATIDELQSPNTPYVKQAIKIQSDPVGYGFVIRGESPIYVQAVDPMGPANAAGLKIRQYIYSVNGRYVLPWDHKAVGRLIMQSNDHVELVVMSHKRHVAI